MQKILGFCFSFAAGPPILVTLDWYVCGLRPPIEHPLLSCNPSDGLRILRPDFSTVLYLFIIWTPIGRTPTVSSVRNRRMMDPLLQKERVLRNL